MSTNAGTAKLSCRTCTAWRSATPASSRGSSARNARISSGSNCLVAMNCHRIGPSLSPSSVSPCCTNRVTDSPASASTLRFVQKRDALTVNMKSTGTVAAQAAQLAGLNVE